MNTLQMPIIPTGVHNLAYMTPSTNQDYFVVSPIQSGFDSLQLALFHAHISKFVNVYYDRVRYGVFYGLADIIKFTPENVLTDGPSFNRIIGKVKVVERYDDETHELVELRYQYNEVTAFTVTVKDSNPVSVTEKHNIVGALDDIQIEGINRIDFDNGYYFGNAKYTFACGGKYAVVISYYVESIDESFDRELLYLTTVLEQYTGKQVLIGDEANESK